MNRKWIALSGRGFAESLRFGAIISWKWAEVAACLHAVFPLSKQAMHVWHKPLEIVTSEEK